MSLPITAAVPEFNNQTLEILRESLEKLLDKDWRNTEAREFLIAILEEQEKRSQDPGRREPMSRL